ncbi:malectin domain-containing carbohydrate-binding protein [Pontibacter sp. E15-1]|uniref:malectin domain-containing carbohydrate-binding protein n=1 Tax=Pontibacter sp. E15-1 TaxID=2919918 RepID=UPI001F4F1B87|nr:malectin domain-containing carbohydrate-binding protein [Pontibacter sp. E15-1]MCJ8164145.1 malectin domain-containing carbohydrate-binding protein [Pontibacter sp. E15-1]
MEKLARGLFLPQSKNKRLEIYWILPILLLLSLTASAQWNRQKDADFKRGEMASVLYDGKIYFFTGFGVWPTIAAVSEAYDPATDVWEQLAPMPEGKAVTHQGCVLVDDKVWLIGGRLENTSGPLTSEVWIYDLKANTWAAGPELIDPATGEALPWGGGGAALLGRTLHVFGGFVYNPCDNDQDTYHLTLNVDAWLENASGINWENSRAPMPMKRNHLSTTVLGGKIYAMGGQFGHDCGGGQDQRYSHAYDPLKDEWTRLADLPTVRSHCEASTFPVDGKIYMSGGDGATDKVTIFTPAANGGPGSWDNAAFELPQNEGTSSNGYIGIGARVIDETFVAACGKIGNTDTRVETYTRSFSRNIPYVLGFSASCYTEVLQNGQTKVLKNLLYTLEGETSYTIASDAPWLRITANATGRAVQSAVYVEAVMDASGLADGEYTATVTAKATNTAQAYTSASFCVTLRVGDVPKPKPEPVLVNAGGQKITDGSGEAWQADAFFSGGVTSSKSFDVLGTSNDALYLTYRFAKGPNSSAAGSPFSYNIPVAEPGEYTVELHFMEPYYKRAGARQFHVDLEGKRVITNYDLYAAHGYGRAVIQSYENISVTDGILQVLFTSVTNNAVISAVKVRKTGDVPLSQGLLVNVGGKGYTDSKGQTWGPDTYASGGVVSSKSFNVAGTTEDPLYLTYRYAQSGAPFSYAIPVGVAGIYTLELHFVEPYFGAPGSSAPGAVGKRVFHVDVEGQRILSNYDIYKESGAGSAVVKSYPNINVEDGMLNIDFTSLENNAIISAIAVRQTSAISSGLAIKPSAAALSHEMTVYPNPNSGSWLYVSVKGYAPEEEIRLVVVDMTGRLLHTLTTSANVYGAAQLQVLPPTQLAKGMYFVQVQGASGKSLQRLLVY